MAHGLVGETPSESQGTSPAIEEAETASPESAGATDEETAPLEPAEIASGDEEESIIRQNLGLDLKKSGFAAIVRARKTPAEEESATPEEEAPVLFHKLLPLD